MRIIKASYEILTPVSDGGVKELQRIEEAARTCYKSEDRITEDGESAKRMAASLIQRGHEAMLEHSQLSVRFIVDRGVSHELVRHRIASFAQESTRYCNYTAGKFGECTFIKPVFFDERTPEYEEWKRTCRTAELAYFHIIDCGRSPQEARAVLPNSLKTEVVMTANYREWRAFFRLRTDESAHPQMREVAVPLLEELKQRIPVIFDDIGV